MAWVVGSNVKSAPKRPLKFSIPDPPLNHVSHTGTTDGVTCEAIAARNGTRIWSRMIVAVPSGNGQQKLGGQAEGMPPQRVSQAPSPPKSAASIPPASAGGASWRASIGPCSRRELLREHPREHPVALRRDLREAGRALPAAPVAEPVGADRPAALAALAGPLGLGLRQLRHAREQPGDRGVALAALHRLQRAGAQARRERGELVARAARPGRRVGRERERPRRRAGGARVPLQLQGEGQHGIADGTCSQAGLPTDAGNTAVTWKHSPVRNSVLP